MYNKTVTLFSTILNRDIKFRIIHPEIPDCKWILLLHGYGGDQEQWVNNTPIESLAMEHGFAVIMPGCGDGYYENTVEPMKTFLGEELVPYIQQNFSVSKQHEDTYIAGVSMGGFGALLVGSHYSQCFSKIACFSGAFIIPDVLIGNPGVLGPADANYFKKVFGDFETLDGSDRDPLYEVTLAAQESRMCPVYLTCGNSDVLVEGNRKVKQHLDQLNIPCEYHFSTGGHDWSFWNRTLPDVIKWLL